jgi:hypothetical protein
LHVRVGIDAYRADLLSYERLDDLKLLLQTQVIYNP